MPEPIMEPPATFESLLRQVSVPITAGTQIGSGFFVAPNRIITCAHVVAVDNKPAESITVHLPGEERSVEVVDGSFQNGNKSVDLVLLKVADYDADYPYAALTSVVEVGDELWVWGYPAGPYRKGDSAIVRYQGMSTREDSIELLKTKGTPLAPGFSGAPVLNLRTGAICGLIRLGSQRPSIVRFDFV